MQWPKGVTMSPHCSGNAFFQPQWAGGSVQGGGSLGPCWDYCPYDPATENLAHLLIISMGSPQSCVLSSLLFTLYIAGLHNPTIIHKFSHTQFSRPSYVASQTCSAAVSWLVDTSQLQLNVSKTKDKVVTYFRTQGELLQLSPRPSRLISGNCAEYLGTIFDDHLRPASPRWSYKSATTGSFI